MIILAWMLIIFEYPNDKKDILYDLQASLPCFPTVNVWGYLSHGTRIRVQIKHYPERKISYNYDISRNVLNCCRNQWTGQQ